MCEEEKESSQNAVAVRGLEEGVEMPSRTSTLRKSGVADLPDRGDGQ